ncbi:MAG: DUF2461 domain-containing protein [Muribaculaceae bacterium]
MPLTRKGDQQCQTTQHINYYHPHPMQNNYMQELYSFLEQLRLNNNRPWFNEHKPQFTALREQWLAQLQQLITLMQSYDSSLRGLQAKDCAYRIYRDTRFSPDKTPYKTFFSAVIGASGRKCTQPCYYLHFEPGDSGIYAGLWCPEPDTLRRMRSLIDACGNELQQIVIEPQVAQYFSFEPMQELKRVPAPYAQNHPLAHLLRAKDYTFAHHVSDDFFTAGNWVEEAARIFSHITPALQFLNYAMHEP